MSNHQFQPGALVLYKIHPALVTSVSDKIEIQLAGDKDKKVRDKDIKLLHPGPLRSLGELTPVPGNVEEAWSLLEGEETDFASLAELIYGSYTPASAWSLYQLLEEDLYFEGSFGVIKPRSAKWIEKVRAEREAKAAEERAHAEFMARVKSGKSIPEDKKYLAEVERLALGQSEHSRLLQSLDIKETPDAAHSFLVRCGYWADSYNPWPARQGAALNELDLAVSELPDETRRDLTHLRAYAIDDEGNRDPDDAISLEGDRLWVHVADVAALVPPDSELDLAARARSANLYLPEGVVNMLPTRITELLGLGLNEVSPALSFSFRLTDDGLADIDIMPSWVRVTRLSYDEVDKNMDDPEFAPIYQFTERFRQMREARGAARIDLPEVSVKVIDSEIQIKPLPRLNSRQMVTDAMLMAGEAAARFADGLGIAIPYAVQPPPDELRQPQTMSEAYAYRMAFKPSNASLTPDKHFGLGLDYYARATSPLRRYVDLLVHQQLRAHLRGEPVADRAVLSERMGAAQAVTGVIRRSERLSNQHWKQLYLARNPGWKGEAVVVALEERKAVVIIPQLALETKIRRTDGMQLDQRIRLRLREVDVAAQEAYFQVLD